MSIPFLSTYYQSTDNMKTFVNEENLHLGGTFFFLADTIQTHSYSPYNYIQLFSDFGGLVDLIMMVFAIIPMMYSDRTVLQKFLRSQYFVKLPDSQVHEPLKFTKKFFQKPEEQEIYEKAEKKLDHEMDQFQIFQQQKKIKATLAQLVGDNIELISNIKYQYFKESTIFVDKEEHIQYEHSKNLFMSFMEEDEIISNKGKALLDQS